MKDPIVTWKGMPVNQMSREELVVALNEACGLIRSQTPTGTLKEIIRRLSGIEIRKARIDGIFIGLVIGTTTGAILASVCWAFFLLT